MTDPAVSIAAFFGNIGGRYPAGSALSEVCALGASSNLDSVRRDEILRAHGLEGEAGTRKHLLDLALEFVRSRLENGRPSEEAQVAIQTLKRFLGIREGDFVKLRPREVQEILVSHLEQALADGRLETQEDAEQAGLQRAFDLGFDEYLQMTRGEYERGIGLLQVRLAAARVAERIALQRQLELLAAVVALASRQDRLSGGSG